MHHVDLATIQLEKGSHPEDGHGCLLEWTARFAGEKVTDHPACTSPVLAAFGIAWNDALDDETRQRLVPFIPRLVGTAGDPEADQVRAWMATDWLVRTFTPTWLRKAGLTARADELVALPALTSSELAGAAAGDAAGDAARAAASKEKGYTAQYDAAYKAARPLLDQAFRETTAELTESAFELFGRMIDVRTAVPA